jgi:hypothetical protein
MSSQNNRLSHPRMGHTHKELAEHASDLLLPTDPAPCQGAGPGGGQRPQAPLRFPPSAAEQGAAPAPEISPGALTGQAFSWIPRAPGGCHGTGGPGNETGGRGAALRRGRRLHEAGYAPAAAIVPRRRAAGKTAGRRRPAAGGRRGRCRRRGARWSAPPAESVDDTAAGLSDFSAGSADPAPHVRA